MSVQVRHGAVLGLAELLVALQRCDTTLTPLARASVAAVVPDVKAARLLLGKGGELMRDAACRRVAVRSCSSLFCLLLKIEVCDAASSGSCS